MRARSVLSLVTLIAAGCASEAPIATFLNTTPSLPPANAKDGAALPVVALDWERQPLLVATDGAPLPDDAPMSLTANDGSGLQIMSLKAQAVIQDPLAFTEIHFVFKNPEPRTIEGRFEITLPPNATVSRFAMLQSQGWQEGEVVELQAAREAYEDALHRKVDPALLEKQGGNRFQARVFPIPASGTKEILFSYSQELTRRSDPYRLYLRGLPSIPALDLRVIVDMPDKATPAAFRREAFEVHKTSFKPDRDLTFALPAAGDGVRALRHDDLAVVRVTPVTEARPDTIESLALLFDTSASRALGFKAQVERLGALIEAIRTASGAELPLAVVAFDQDAEIIFKGRAADFGRRELDKILERKPLGASNVQKALRFAAQLQGAGGPRFTRALLVTDGIATAGESSAEELKPDLKNLGGAGTARIDALVDGGIRDEAWLKSLAVGALARNGVVLDAALSASSIAQRLRSATVSGIKVNVPGARWVWPSVLQGVQPGDQAIVFAVLPSRESPFEVELSDNDKRDKLNVKASFVERPLLERAAVNAQISKLMAERSALPNEELREQWKSRIIDLSTRYRVLSDFTALLVLESEEDYARFKIDRRALADILTVGPRGVELLDRKARVSTAMVAAPEPPSASPTDVPRAEAPRSAPPPSSPRRNPGKGGHAMDKKSSASTAPRLRPSEAVEEKPEAPPPPPPPPVVMAPAPDFGPAQEAEAPPPPMATFAPPPPLQLPARPAPAKPGPMRSLDDSAPRPPPSAAPMPSRPPESGASAGGRPASNRPASEPRARPTAVPPSRMNGHPTQVRQPPQDFEGEDVVQGTAPYVGRFRDVMTLVARKSAKEALAAALQWREVEPGDALAMVGLGEAFEALGQKDAAARAYGSILDLFPSRADLRRFAGVRLERIGALELAVDTFQKAAAQRPDHPASHRLLAYALLRVGKPAEAFEAIVSGLTRGYPPGRFAGVYEILRDDAGLLAAAWIRAQPAKRATIIERLATLGVPLSTSPSLRFVLNWETDANDVDFHIRDGAGGHAYYGSRSLRSGGRLYADVTTGYGPECFTIEGKPRAYPYRLKAHYFSKGPMGYGMGKLQIIEHDGSGRLTFEERPFVVMTDSAYVDLGSVKGPLQ